MVIEPDLPLAQLTDVCDMQSFYPTMSPDGSLVASFAAGGLTVINCKTGKTVKRCSLDGWVGLKASWSPDGKQIAFGGFGDTNRVGLWLLDVASG